MSRMAPEAASPLYLQVKRDLREKMFSGELNPGDRVPSERELAERFQVSRMTARHALREMEAEGTLTRVQGSGSFISQPKLIENVVELASFTEDMERRGLTPSARVLNVSLQKPDEVVRGVLHLNVRQQVWQINRLRFADGVPMALETMFLVADQFSTLGEHDLSGSIYRLLEETYALKIGDATQTIEAVFPSAMETQMLCAPPQTALLRLKKLTRTQGGQPFEFVTALYRGDRYAFEATLSRTQDTLPR
ncbi:GntR family transcriptional regulator [Deinococcus humi]|uniref:GntR family transcriptional regulator n=1 Tax=Deinococcus humi TaxID=662880 RepID=A0A7W8JZG3_9DEIO|nr:GntR family transcriptional regulator [Deinococcus humi]MBB5364616.1 GntR family transcriptional regulator [Deinococcus humi]GGO39171.1 phosphonate metabolism transcriptional regulator PhnF [Deinococcus humi]